MNRYDGRTGTALGVVDISKSENSKVGVQNAVNRINENAKTALKSFWEIGHELGKIQRLKSYTHLGFKSFRDFLESDNLKVHFKTAYAWIKIAETITKQEAEKHSVSVCEVIAYNPTKKAEILKLHSEGVPANQIQRRVREKVDNSKPLKKPHAKNPEQSKIRKEVKEECAEVGSVELKRKKNAFVGRISDSHGLKMQLEIPALRLPKEVKKLSLKYRCDY